MILSIDNMGEVESTMLAVGKGVSITPLAVQIIPHSLGMLYATVTDYLGFVPWKEEGKVRYIGITTSHQRNHAELEQIMRQQPIDFVQFSYNIDNRLAEQRLLPIAAERGIATLINRPYQRGALFQRSAGKPLPGLATELGCDSWGQFFLKFIIGHPAVSCLIPATAKLHHMQDNMGANFGPVPDPSQRRDMLKIYQSL